MSKAEGRMTKAVLFALALLAGACSPAAPPPSQATPPIVSRPAPEPARPSGDEARTAPTPAPDRAGPARAAEPRARVEGDARVEVDLERDEARGGHTIARHVGRTDAQLRVRLARESISAASTYADLETAERVVAQALASNERRVQRWLDQRGPRSNLAIRYRARDGLPTGRMLRRGEATSEEVTGAVVVLRWRDETWYVLTSYPEEPR